VCGPNMHQPVEDGGPPPFEKSLNRHISTI